jgi:hypothetical protein
MRLGDRSRDRTRPLSDARGLAVRQGANRVPVSGTLGPPSHSSEPVRRSTPAMVFRDPPYAEKRRNR